MILGRIDSYTVYRHLETGKLVEVRTPDLMVKYDGENWKTFVEYIVKDDVRLNNHFAVPLDVFRVKFEEHVEG